MRWGRRWVPETAVEEFDQAVDAASQTFKSWSKQSVLARQRFAVELQCQICQNVDALAHSIVLEQPLPMLTAMSSAPVFKSSNFEAIKTRLNGKAACIPGDSEGLEKECKDWMVGWQALLVRKKSAKTWKLKFESSLGICASIAPFNFPAQALFSPCVPGLPLTSLFSVTPHWTIPY
ncbi:hypothetical protein DEU56DRAFT_929876 [Suillus clintonianus]|uniref:uncharacterized protein n=1 Tax=Suillus clintonianus TaxID=1904413 RepID=UPI001B86B436|nr:uncharacterized protein DEU56DRAFT_929876 [Suillus clintonianus]KAG2118608.1 hypothetical protein DEU56DRAFT_929876 [Suillus clintonianus]